MATVHSDNGSVLVPIGRNGTMTLAELADHVAVLQDNNDHFFLVVMGMIILFMQCGFAFLEAGSVRSKNVTNILMKNLFDSFVSGIAYWIFGFAFAYGDTGNTFIGSKYFASSGLEESKYAYFFFQYTFAATSATIVSGAVAERCEFLAYLIYSFVITGFIFPVLTHWVWGGGFLAQGKDYGGDIGHVGYLDFAGSGLVHICGGVAALCGAYLIGPRKGRFDTTGTPSKIRGHSVPIAALGGFILFLGFLAFNGGSEGKISAPEDGIVVSRAVVNTVLSGSFGAISSLVINRTKIFGNSSWSLSMSINGALTGMVANGAGANAMYPWGAFILGSISGIAYNMWSYLVMRFRIDDPLDAVAVHLGGGTWGVIGVAFLHKDNGILLHWNHKAGLQLCWQLAGMVCITVWTFVFATAVFGILKLCKILRVSEDHELEGLDEMRHKEPAYPEESLLRERLHNLMEQAYEQSLLAKSNEESPYQNLRATESHGMGAVGNNAMHSEPTGIQTSVM